MSTFAVGEELEKVLGRRWKSGSLRNLCVALQKAQRKNVQLDHLSDEMSLALRHARPEEIETLIAAGADVAFEDGAGATALHDPASPGAAMKLVELGAAVDAVDLHGNSALHAAVAQNNGYLLRTLIELGVPDVANNKGRFFRDLFVGSCEVAGRRASVSNAVLEAHLDESISWELNINVIDLVHPQADFDDVSDESYWMNDARLYMEEIASWKARCVADWRDLVRAPIRWSDSVDPDAKFSGFYCNAHARLAASTLSFSNVDSAACDLHWTGSLDGELGFETFAVRCRLAFRGVVCEGETPEVKAKLEHYFNDAEWQFQPWWGRALAVPAPTVI